MPANYRLRTADTPTETILLITALVLIYAATLMVAVQRCDAVPYWTGPETTTTNNEQRGQIRVATETGNE